MKNTALKLTIFSLSLSVNSIANAGLVTQHTSVDTHQRTCPGLQDPNYISNWKTIVELLYDREATTQLMCHFNGGNQRAIYNNDGTVRSDSPFPDMPEGVAFTDEEVGGVEIIRQTGRSLVTMGDNDGKYYANVILDENNLGLPQIKVKSDSASFERNSVNGFAATEYLWSGEGQTLEYTMDFDFFNSGGTWNDPDTADFHDYIFSLWFGAATDMLFDSNQTFPLDYGTELASGYFGSVGQPIIAATADNPYTSSLSVSFNVNTGDQFFLYGQVQAFGLNGGFVDASNTATSRLAVQGLTQEESNVMFTSSLSAAPSTAQVPEPSTIAMFTLAIFGLISRRVNR